jgi:peptidyl-prolyl cis-trans isomerase B (cyclophilin B)
MRKLTFISLIYVTSIVSVNASAIGKICTNPVAEFNTNQGIIDIELNRSKAPLTVANFEKYINSGFYSKKIFHRVIANFMIQGGGFDEKMVQAPTSVPIKNEANNGLKNDKYTIAMARTNDPNSATAQFFINVKNNDFLNYTPNNPGYAVFGKVVKGESVVDKIANVTTSSQGMYDDVPVKPIIINSAKMLPCTK